MGRKNKDRHRGAGLTKVFLSAAGCGLIIAGVACLACAAVRGYPLPAKMQFLYGAAAASCAAGIAGNICVTGMRTGQEKDRTDGSAPAEAEGEKEETHGGENGNENI